MRFVLEPATQLPINADDCIDCGNCADLCGQDPIYPLDDLSEAKAQSAERNRAYFQ